MLKKLPAKHKVIVITALVIVTAGLWLGGSIYNLLHNKLELRRLTKKRNTLDAEYQHLLEEKKLLEDQDPAYMEMLARTRYNMVKPGEIEYRIKHD